jgi:gamma-glutamyltranspeptidase/glutathione hydrolase
MKRLLTALVITLAFAATPSRGQTASESVAPEAKTGTLSVAADPAVSAALAEKEAGRAVTAGKWMVVANNPLATAAGAKILRAGGSAADAMIAVQSVLGLVEPQSSGLGGGAFLVWYDAESGKLTTLDGRETAPLAARPELFLDANGEPLKFFDAVVGGLSVGTPGTPRLMEAAHRRWGRMAWRNLFDDAIALAENGFEVSPRLAGLVARDSERLSRFPATAAYFLPGGTPLQEGTVLKNPAYGKTLEMIAAEGADAIYSGPIARNIVNVVNNAPGNPGVLAPIDLELYRVVEREPVCVVYRLHDVCGMGPPSSGAMTIGEILGMLRGHDLSALGPESPEAWRLIGDASRLAFADRGLYMADTDFVPVPSGLLKDDYLADRAKLLDRKDALPEAEPGEPQWDHAELRGDGVAIELPSTSQISIVDSYGNALSMTTTIENAFGSRLMTPDGFLLNNELTDFSFATHDEDGRPVANRVEPGKRPRSSMSPTIVLQDGKPVFIMGSPGGSSIIAYVLQAIIAHFDWGMDVQQAVAMPHLLNRFGTFEVEAGTTAEALAEPLRALGYIVKVGDQNSGLAGIAIGATLSGGADPRREGIALGE